MLMRCQMQVIHCEDVAQLLDTLIEVWELSWSYGTPVDYEETKREKRDCNADKENEKGTGIVISLRTGNITTG